jgi:hypothetical protein
MFLIHKSAIFRKVIKFPGLTPVKQALHFIGQAFHGAGAKIAQKRHSRMETRQKSTNNKHGNIFFNLNQMTSVANLVE